PTGAPSMSRSAGRLLAMTPLRRSRLDPVGNRKTYRAELEIKEAPQRAFALIWSRLRRYGVVDSTTVAHEVFMSHDELSQRSIDFVEIDVGDETVDAGIDGGGILPMDIAYRGNKIGEYA